jgi:hypothetical protein
MKVEVVSKAASYHMEELDDVVCESLSEINGLVDALVD